MNGQTQRQRKLTDSEIALVRLGVAYQDRECAEERFRQLMRAARDAGATHAQIAEAVGLTRQAVQAWFGRNDG